MSEKGHFVWYDLMTTDKDAAIDFYGGVFGWGTQPFDAGGEPYTMFTNDGTPLGGVNALPEEVAASGVPPHWLSYVSVPDVDATVERAEKLGGASLHPATDIPSVGRFAVIRDPHGAILAPYKSASPQPPAGPPQAGRFSWHELISDDHEAAYDFYADLFGWEKQEAMDMGPAGTYQIYGLGGMPLGGMMNKPPEMPVAAWLYYVMVGDIDDAIDSVKARGGMLLNGPMDVPGGDKVAQCQDPQGAAFALHQSGASA